MVVLQVAIVFVCDPLFYFSFAKSHVQVIASMRARAL